MGLFYKCWIVQYFCCVPCHRSLQTSKPVTATTPQPTTQVTTTPVTNGTLNVTTVTPPHTTAYSTVTSKNSSSATSSSNGPGTISFSSTVVPGVDGSTTTSVIVIPFYTLATPALWKPAVTECTHIFSTYVVPNILHFLAFITGFYLFRIQESEGLNALIEKVLYVLFGVWVESVVLVH